MSGDGIKKRKPQLLPVAIYILILTIIILYRAFILLQYNAEFIDEDQALMWNGAAAFSHFIMPEPCFWGQSYGSMFESFLAAPLLWLKIPLKYAVPASTAMIGFFPFLFISYLLYKNNFKLESCITLMLYLSHGWKWDIITSIPRSFVSGFPFAVIGTILLNDERRRSYAGIGTFIAGIGAIMTPTSIMVTSFGFLNYLFNIKKKSLKQHLYIFTALLSCGIIYLLIKNFYSINPDFSLHRPLYYDISFETLMYNIRNIPELFKDFTFTGIWMIVLIAFIAGIIYSFLKKQWKLTIMLAVHIFLALGLMSMTKTLRFTEHSVLHSQTRMFLCFSYSALPILYFYTDDLLLNKGHNAPNFCQCNRKTLLSVSGAILLLIFGVIFKANNILAEINDPESSLNNPGACQLRMIDPLTARAKEVIEYSRENNIDVIVVKNDTRPFAYLLDAMYFQEFVYYNITYDRRTWVYHYLEQITPHRCLFVSYHDDYISTTIFTIEDESVIQFIAENYGMYRNS